MGGSPAIIPGQMILSRTDREPTAGVPTGDDSDETPCGLLRKIGYS